MIKGWTNLKNFCSCKQKTLIDFEWKLFCFMDKKITPTFYLKQILNNFFLPCGRWWRCLWQIVSFTLLQEANSTPSCTAPPAYLTTTHFSRALSRETGPGQNQIHRPLKPLLCYETLHILGTHLHTFTIITLWSAMF